MTYETLLHWGRDRLTNAGIQDAQTDSWLLLEYVISRNRAWYIAHRQDEADEKEKDRYERVLTSRCRRIPLQHITGVQNFMGLDFVVTPKVLIPRQDTEVLVEKAMEMAKGGKKVLDMCTGSGCIAISLKHYMPTLEVSGIDISQPALEVARENGRRLNAEVHWMQSDLFENAEGEYSLIVSNPPYIERDEIAHLEPEVRDHDPRLALDGGQDGMDIYRRLIKEAPAYLETGGWFMVEIGYQQGRKVSELFKKHDFQNVTVYPDLAGIDRIVAGQK